MKLFFIILTLTTALLMLLFPNVTSSYAKEGLLIWLQNVLPSLYPFMVLQSILIQMHFDETLGKILSPLLKKIFPLSNNAFFAIPVGFLCGFPMGAIITTYLYQKQKINKTDAELLLSFCNNIGPVYSLTMILPLFDKKLHLYIMLLIYGIPFLYGIIITNLTAIRKKKKRENKVYIPENTKSQTDNSLKPAKMLFKALQSSGVSILTLGGCMIFFSILRIFTDIIPKNLPIIHCIGTGFLEPGSFISLISQKLNVINTNCAIILLSLIIPGGLSCTMQTLSIICETDLSIKKYIFNKIAQTILWIIICIFLFSLKQEEIL